MIKFIIREIFSSLISLFIFLLIMFYGINLLIPGDFLTPLRLMMSQAELDALRESLGVSDPLYLLVVLDKDREKILLQHSFQLFKFLFRHFYLHFIFQEFHQSIRQ